MLMPVSVFLGIGAAILAPWIARLAKERAKWVLSAVVFAGFCAYLTALPAISAGRNITLSFPWVSSVQLDFTFYLDGLSLLMGLIVSGIGVLVVLYGGEYLKDHPHLPRFYCLILLFMSAMLGLVFSGNALLLFLFWELTSISSFFLIGYDHERAAARASAWQALFVTGAGGLAMLAGFILLSVITGSFEIQTWIGSASAIQGHPLAPAAFILILLGAMTKSAQFPFHFWLPNAMEAPTPVSAFLHSATMVKAGVYLLARLLPVFGGMAMWGIWLPVIGLATLVAGSLLALGQTDLKRLLAYTTIGALGLLVFLLGLGEALAVKAALTFLFAHALYKGALFLVAGGIDHAAHSRDVSELGGLGKAMPFTFTAAALAALSMAGLPPFFGFITKELLYENTLYIAQAPLLTTALVLISMVATVAVAGWVGFTPFLAKPARQFHPHESPVALWLPPMLLALVGLAAGLFPQAFANGLFKAGAEALLLTPQKVKLSLWHGITPMLGLSGLTVLAGAGVYAARRWVMPLGKRIWHLLGQVGPASLYQRGLGAVLSFAAWQTRVLQSGYLRIYALFVVVTTLGLSVLTMATRLEGFPSIVGKWAAPRFYDVVLIGIIIVAAVLVTQTRSRLATIAILGSIGYSIAILYLLYSAPDLAMVQFAIETLTVILFILMIYRLPKFAQLTSRRTRLTDAVFAVAGGGLMTVLMLLVSSHPMESLLAKFYAENSLLMAYGRNIVNVILVDFRGFDTMGEITVLGIAAIGVYALIHQYSPKAKEALSLKQKMQRSILLEFSVRYMMPLIMIFSIFLLMRGHNKVGGGFVGGLVAASAFMLYAIAISPAALRRLLPLDPRWLVAGGLLVALLSGMIAVFSGAPFMTGLWLKEAIIVVGKVGSPILFDIGVYLVVVGIVLWIMLTISEEEP